MNTDRLAELAAEATPGPWSARRIPEAADNFWSVDGPAGEGIALTGREDAAYIAALQPQTVLRLIAVVRAAQALDVAGSDFESAWLVPRADREAQLGLPVAHLRAKLAALRAALREVSE